MSKIINTTFLARKTSLYLNLTSLLQENLQKRTSEYQTLRPHCKAGQLQPYAALAFQAERSGGTPIPFQQLMDDVRTLINLHGIWD